MRRQPGTYNLVVSDNHGVSHSSILGPQTIKLQDRPAAKSGHQKAGEAGIAYSSIWDGIKGALGINELEHLSEGQLDDATDVDGTVEVPEPNLKDLSIHQEESHTNVQAPR